MWKGGSLTPSFLISAIKGINGHIHKHVALAQKKAPGTSWIAGWMGPRAGLEHMQESSVSCPFQE
jgi:hypothetical protein